MPLKRVQHLVSESLYLTSLMLVSILVLITAIVRLHALPNLAAILPADGTQAFVVFNSEDYNFGDLQIIGLPLTDLTWASKFMGYALIDNELVTFVKVKSESSAQEYLEGLLLEKEALVAENGITCYEESQPNCFTYIKPFLAFSSSKESLMDLGGEETLESADAYQNSKGRLPGRVSAFAYLDLQASMARLTQAFGYEPGYLETVLRLFPSLAATVKMENKQWYSEAFIAIDKSLINDEAYYRSSSKYKSKLLAWTNNNYIFEWGGQDLGAQIKRISEILAEINSAAALVFDTSISAKTAEFFGEEIDLSILSEEYYFGWTPGEDFMFMLELDGEDAIQTVAALKDKFINNYSVIQTNKSSLGEIFGTSSKLEAKQEKHVDDHYFTLKNGDELVAAILITEELVLVTSSEDQLIAALDKIRARQEERSLSDFDEILSGADEMSTLQVTNLPDEHILKSVLSHFTQIISTRKIFDDGIYFRSLLLLE